MLDFTASLYKELIEYSKDTQEEKCGFILKNLHFVPLDNIAGNKEENFMIDARQFLKYKKDLLAIFHSHPEGGDVSPEDKLACARINIPWLILSSPKTFYYITPKEETCLQYDYMDI